MEQPLSFTALRRHRSNRCSVHRPLGAGTEGILWTYDFGAFPDSTYKFLDLTGGVKSYVLDQMDNHMGAVTKCFLCRLDPFLSG